MKKFTAAPLTDYPVIFRNGLSLLALGLIITMALIYTPAAFAEDAACVNSQHRLMITATYAKSMTTEVMCFRNRHEADEAYNSIKAQRYIPVPTKPAKKFVALNLIKIYTD